MSFETRRRRILQSLNTRYIYGIVPLLHALVFLTELIMASILLRKFNASYAARPILTTMITNALLGGIADTTAQLITAVRVRAVTKPGGLTSDDTLAIEIHSLDRKNPFQEADLIPDNPPRGLPPPFDFERLLRFMGYGFMMAPVQYKWFGFLSRTFPMPNAAGVEGLSKGARKITGTALGAASRRVAFDQLLFSPVGLACFFTFMTVAEGGGREAVGRKFRDVYVPALKANYVLWPAVQMLNFRVVPLQFQIPFVSTIGIAWTAYLSLTNASEGLD